ncbi:MAG: metal ABC transporter permease [Actinomycetota bacterium]|nr:metal ABC transporter permease [Actinomycetota bacterium]
MFAHEFVRNAYLAGTAIALACGVIGWFVLLRAQLFAGDAMSHFAFVGAVGAAAAGIDLRIGLFSVTIWLAGAMAALGRQGAADDTVIGIVFAWVLGIGVLLLAVLAGSSAGGDAVTASSTLFGGIYALSASGSELAAGIALLVIAAVAAIFRPLLLSTLDSELAVLRGVPVRALGGGFLGLLAIVAAESTQAVGALLLLGLLSAPAGAAHKLTASPYRGVALSAALAVAAMWGGLALSYAVPALPPSSAIIGLAAAGYAGTSAGSALRRVRRPRGGIRGDASVTISM